MQVQVFKHNAAMLGINVLKINLTAVLSDQAGAPVVGKTIQFKYDDAVVKAVPTNESGEAKSGEILIEVKPDSGNLIMAVPEGLAVRGSFDFGDLLKSKPMIKSQKPGMNQWGEPKLERPKGFKALMLAPLLAFVGISIVGSLVVFFALLRKGFPRQQEEQILIGLLFYIPGVIGVTVVFLRQIYLAWKGIQVEGVSIEPGKAVGYLFIPFFNFYWIFIGLYQLTTEYNRLNLEHGIGAPKAPTTDALVMSIAFILACITFGYFPLALFALFWGMVMVYIKMNKVGEAFHRWNEAQEMA